MPGKRIKDLTALSGAGSANNDDVVIFDADADATKRISRSQLAEGMQADVQVFSNKTINLGSNTLTGTTAQFNTALSDNNFATQAGSEVLTNKTIDSANNTLTVNYKEARVETSDASRTHLFTTVAALLADTGTYTTYAAGQIVEAGGFRYQVATSIASDHHLTTAGGVKLYVLAGDNGYNVKAFGAVGDGVADDTAEIQTAINSAAPLGISVFIPAGTYKITTLTLPQQHGGIEVYGEASNSGYNLENGIYRGSVLLSSSTSGNVLSCDGGAGYSNRGIRLRNFSLRVVTSGYAIYLKNSPEQNLLQNLTIHNANVSGGSGVGLESCWVGTRVDGCLITAALAGASNIGLHVFNALKAGGLSVKDTTINKFWKGVQVGDNVYQARFVNVGSEANKYGFFIDGNDPNCVLEQCHFEFNTDIALFIKKSGGGILVKKCSFYRNAETASGIKAEIAVSGGGLDFNYTTRIQDNYFFGIGTNVTGVYVQNSSFGSGIIENNNFAAFGTGTVGVYVGGSNLEYWEVVNNLTASLATAYNPTSGYKRFSDALSAHYQIRFAATPFLSSDPNTLDDYEEGSWTPVLGGDGGETGQVYAQQVGYYQKIGRVVYFTFLVELSTEGTVGLEAKLKGLPFTIFAASGLSCGYVNDFANLETSVVDLSLRADVGTTSMYFRALTAAAASKSFVVASSLYTNTTLISGGGWYIAS